MIEQLLCHLWGDYILQSDWMAQNKTKDWFPALIHAMLYTLCFLPLLGAARTPWAGVVICGTHFLIDRYRLARYLVWLKNWMGPFYRAVEVRYSPSMRKTFRHWERHNPMPPLADCPTGSPPFTPVWLSVWLLIIADNTLHMTINYLALRYL
jgi:hypothetical protein